MEFRTKTEARFVWGFKTCSGSLGSFLLVGVLLDIKCFSPCEACTCGLRCWPAPLSLFIRPWMLLLPERKAVLQANATAFLS